MNKSELSKRMLSSVRRLTVTERFNSKEPCVDPTVSWDSLEGVELEFALWETTRSILTRAPCLKDVRVQQVVRRLKSD